MSEASPASLCLVIPCFRESGRLRPFLSDLCAAFQSLEAVSILVVDDGSGEEDLGRLRTLVDEFRSEHPFVREVLPLPQNVGKGGTVYAGWEQAADAEWLMFADADGSVPAYEVARIIQLARESGRGDQAWFASRVTMLGKCVERTLHRDIMGQVFHWIVNIALALRAHDTQCGCKLLPRAAFHRARPALTLTGFAFDLDLLMALRSGGSEVIEVPVDWHEVAGGKIKLLRDPWVMLEDVMKIRRKQKAGHYDKIKP